MKIWFRIGPDRGNEQDGPQPPERYCSPDRKMRFLHPGRFSGARLVRPFTLKICEGGRFRGTRLLPAHPLVPRPLLLREHGVKSPTRLAESEQLSGNSTRFWSKSRSYRKQNIKALLPGATTTCKRSHFSAHLCPPFESQMIQRSAAFASAALRAGRVLFLPGETATNGLHRTHPE
jgi:hypothetical protein